MRFDQKLVAILLAAVVILMGISFVSYLRNYQRQRALRDICYGKAIYKHSNLLDIYLPPDKFGPFPLVIWIHGGGWAGGDKEHPPAAPFLAKGLALASINYRLSKEAKFPAQIEDCKLAVAWLKNHALEYNFDTNHLGVWGGSAGGHLAALLGTTDGITSPSWAVCPNHDSCKVQAVCDWSGPSDLRLVKNGSLAFLVTKLLGVTPQDNPELAYEASPIKYVNKDAPPFLIMHGEDDELVPVMQSKILYEALKSKGVDCKLMVVPHVRHNLFTEENIEPVVSFFERTLKPGTK